MSSDETIASLISALEEAERRYSTARTDCSAVTKQLETALKTKALEEVSKLKAAGKTTVMLRSVSMRLTGWVIRHKPATPKRLEGLAVPDGYMLVVDQDDSLWFVERGPSYYNPTVEITGDILKLDLSSKIWIDFVWELLRQNEDSEAHA